MDDNDITLTDGDVVVRGRPAVAVYRNEHGIAVIRQRGRPDDDEFVPVPPLRLRPLVQAPIEVAAEPLASAEIKAAS